MDATGVGNPGHPGSVRAAAERQPTQKEGGTMMTSPAYLLAMLTLSAVLGLIPASIASDKGHRFGDWWLYGFLLFPVALIHSLLAPTTDKAKRQGQALKGFKRCPFCAEMVRPDAIVCRYCGRELPDDKRAASGSPDEAALDEQWKRTF
jgi:hypothetical protein